MAFRSGLCRHRTWVPILSEMMTQAAIGFKGGPRYGRLRGAGVRAQGFCEKRPQEESVRGVAEIEGWGRRDAERINGTRLTESLPNVPVGRVTALRTLGR